MKAKNLALILVTGISLAGCGFGKIYYYEGKIGNESIITSNNRTNIFNLYVTKEDGRKIDYYDFIRNGKLDSVTITKGKESQTYTEDIIGKEALQVAQKQYTDYLAKILEIKKKQALEDIQ